jgi:hypothetical protein
MLHVSSIGNRWQQNGIFASSLTFNGNNNRIDGAGDTFTYDGRVARVRGVNLVLRSSYPMGGAPFEVGL